jgi:hypothetical protein
VIGKLGLVLRGPNEAAGIRVPLVRQHGRCGTGLCDGRRVDRCTPPSEHHRLAFGLVGLLQGVELAASEYAGYAVVSAPGSWPGGALAAWLSGWTWLLAWRPQGMTQSWVWI